MPSKDVEKLKAYRHVRTALERGILHRPDACECCGVAPPRGRDGRVLIQAHHHAGYQDALNVTWLCTSCHSDETPRAVGERNPNAKLSDTDVLEIIGSDASNPEIAAMYGIDQRYAWAIRKGKWRKLAMIEPEGGE